jgi:hypothetical protein
MWRDLEVALAASGAKEDLERYHRVEYVADLLTRKVIRKVSGPRHPDIGVVVMEPDGVLSTGVVLHEPAGVFPSPTLVAQLLLLFG